MIPRGAQPDKALQPTANTPFQLSFGRLLAFDSGGSAASGGAVVRSPAPNADPASGKLPSFSDSRGTDQREDQIRMTSKSDDAAAVRVFPPGIPLAAILLGVGLNWLWPIDPGFGLPSPERYWIGGAIVLGAILVLGLWSVVLFRRGGQSENPWKPTPHIEESGPFRVTRNPMYLQMVLVCIGFAVLLMNWWVLVLTPVAAWILQRFVILPEEAYLERKFGDTYLSYKKRVRRWL